MKKIGEGLSCSSPEEVVGELIYIKTLEDVIDLFDKAFGKICIIDNDGTTALSPILSELAGVVCTTGGMGSHLAIVSREFEIPCIMNLNLAVEDITSLNNKKAKIITEKDNKGILYLID
ncbi:MAG: PEP-utilizing enzyme [Promethearchaeota archaeon]